MKIQEKPPEAANESPGVAAIFQLETENASLRRMLVELLEKNQQLRDQLQMLESTGKTQVSTDFAASHKVDPRAA